MQNIQLSITGIITIYNVFKLFKTLIICHNVTVLLYLLYSNKCKLDEQK